MNLIHKLGFPKHILNMNPKHELHTSKTLKTTKSQGFATHIHKTSISMLKIPQSYITYSKINTMYVYPTMASS